jgi:hypothetical protein
MFESRGTRDHILLSEIRDFPFRRLLRLAGARWRYSSPPTYGIFDPQVNVKVSVTLRLTVSQSVRLGVEPRLGLMTRYLLLFDSYGLCFSTAPTLTRGWVCLLYMLLVLVSVAFLRSVSLGTRDHILLSQIWDFPFRRLLRLAGSRWRYSNHTGVKVKVKVKAMLRPTVQSASPSWDWQALGLLFISLLRLAADRRENMKCNTHKIEEMAIARHQR